MTGFYDLVDIKTCDISVNGAFKLGSQGHATHSGLLQLGQLFFEDAVFGPGLRETIISLGQVDAQGCSTKIAKGKMEVSEEISSNNFKFVNTLRTKREDDIDISKVMQKLGKNSFKWLKF